MGDVFDFGWIEMVFADDFEDELALFVAAFPWLWTGDGALRGIGCLGLVRVGLWVDYGILQELSIHGMVEKRVEPVALCLDLVEVGDFALDGEREAR